MIESARLKRRLLVFLAVTTTIVVGSFVYLSAGFVQNLPVHKAPATVVGKALFHVKEWDPKFSNKHDSWQAGFEEYRIYYAIDDFPTLDESLRNTVLEQDRELSGEATRYRIKDKAQYDKTKLGDKMIVVYQVIGGGKIDIIGVFLPDEIQKAP